MFLKGPGCTRHCRLVLGVLCADFCQANVAAAANSCSINSCYHTLLFLLLAVTCSLCQSVRPAAVVLLCQECAVVHHDSISSNTDAVLAYLHHMRPSEQSYSQFDMGSLVAAVAPVQVCCSWRIFTTFASGHMQL